MRAITMEDRLRRYRVMEKASQYADEAIQKHVDAMSNVPGNISNELQLKAAKWLFEAAYGKPGQAIQLETAPDVAANPGGAARPGVHPCGWTAVLSIPKGGETAAFCTVRKNK